MYCEESCLICRDNIFNLHKKIGLPFDDAIVYEDDNIFVTPDIAPISLGHLLIISNEHINSFGDSDDKVFDSVSKVVSLIARNIYRSGSFFLFEHGAVIEHTAGACIDHAHMHIIPLLSGLQEGIDNYIHETCFVSSDKVQATRSVLQNFARSKQPYIFYSTGRNESWAYPVNRLPVQFMRSLVAYFVKVEYNWKLTYYTDRSRKLYLETLNLAKNTSLDLA